MDNKGQKKRAKCWRAFVFVDFVCCYLISVNVPRSSIGRPSKLR